MGTDKQEEEDDGRVIADMSGIETPSLFAPFSGRKKIPHTDLCLYEGRIYCIRGSTLLIPVKSCRTAGSSRITHPDVGKSLV